MFYDTELFLNQLKTFILKKSYAFRNYYSIIYNLVFGPVQDFLILSYLNLILNSDM